MWPWGWAHPASEPSMPTTAACLSSGVHTLSSSVLPLEARCCACTTCRAHCWLAMEPLHSVSWRCEASVALLAWSSATRSALSMSARGSMTIAWHVQGKHEGRADDDQPEPDVAPEHPRRAILKPRAVRRNVARATRAQWQAAKAVSGSSLV